jgi:CDP-paratose 2-epimerase
MNVLIPGGTGLVGVNIAVHAIKAGIKVTVVDSLCRFGALQNLEDLRSQVEFELHQIDVRDALAVESTVRRVEPAAIFHLAGQVAMTSSLSDPRCDFEVNALDTLNVLEAVRKEGLQSAVFYASTNRVYGDLLQYTYVKNDTRYACVEFPRGFDESVSLDFHSPYGCSKGSADQYVLDYCRMFEIPTVVFRHSSMYGGRQFATVDQGWEGGSAKKLRRHGPEKGVSLASPETANRLDICCMWMM